MGKTSKSNKLKLEKPLPQRAGLWARKGGGARTWQSKRRRQTK